MTMGLQNLSGQLLGQYKLRDLLGIGGMGAVYRADQPALGRSVAIKIMSPELVNDSGYIERFYREAKIAAVLEHAHIIPVYDYGVQGDISYLVMRLLTGGSLMDRITQQNDNNSPLPSVRDVADLLNQLASALDYAHSQGVIHRDIKPNNVMFDNQGNAYLVDFGIAKLLKATQAITTTGVVMGTPLFMPPEQWRAEEITPAADQYALAVMIYILLTGRAPFMADTPHGLMYKHLTEMPTPPQTYRSEVPQSATLVLERAMAKDPAQRYPTVTAFAQSFERTLTAEASGRTNFFSAPVKRTRPAGLGATGVTDVSRIRGLTPVSAARNRRWLWWGAGALVILVIGLLGILILSSRGGTPTSTPSSAPTQVALGLTSPPAPTTGPSSAPTQAGSQPTSEKITVAPGPGMEQTITSTLILPETQVWLDWTATVSHWTPTPLPPPTNTPNYTATYGAQMAVIAQTVTAQSWTSTPTITPTATTTPTITPTATATATATNTPMPTVTPTPALAAMANPPPQYVISRGNAANLTQWTALQTQGYPHALSFSPDGTQLAVIANNSVQFYDLQTLQVVRQFDVGYFGSHVAFSSDWKWYAGSSASSGDRGVKVWDLQTGALVQHFDTLNDINSLDFWPGTSRLAVAAGKVVKIVDIESGQEVKTVPVNASMWVSLVVVSPDGKFLMVHTTDGSILVDTATWTLKPMYQWPVVDIFSPDSTKLVTVEGGGSCCTLKFRELPGTRELGTFPISNISESSPTVFSPDGQLLAWGSDDTTIRLMDVKTGKELISLVGHTDGVNDVAFSPNGTAIASISEREGTLRLWGLPLAAAVPATAVLTSTPAPIALTRPPAQFIISPGNAATLTQRTSIQLDGYPSSLAFSPDGKQFIVTAGTSGTALRFYDLQTLEITRQFDIGYFSSHVAYSPDGTLFAASSASSGDRGVKVWDMNTGATVQHFEALAEVNGLAFWPNTKLLAVTPGKVIKILNIETGQEVKTIPLSTYSTIGNLLFTPDGKSLIATTTDKLMLVDTATWKVQQLDDSAPMRTALSPDGTKLVAVYSGATCCSIKIRELPGGRELRSSTVANFGRSSSLAFSSDGQLLAWTSDDNGVRVWDVQRGQELITLTGHSDEVNGIVFSPDGTTLATISWREENLRLWALPQQ